MADLVDKTVTALWPSRAFSCLQPDAVVEWRSLGEATEATMNEPGS
jgi:hypothetical protein